MHNNSILSSLYSLTSTTTAPSSTLSVTSALLISSLPKEGTLNLYHQFSNAYRPIHGWLSTAVCLFGIPSNLLNIIVLTRANMISSPTNLILTGLALSDLLTMLSSLPFTIYFYLAYPHLPNDDTVFERDTKVWTYFSMLHVMTSVTFHSISTWLTVYLACFRYIYLSSASPPSCDSPSDKTMPPRKSTRNSIATTVARCLTQCRSYNFTLVAILSISLFCILFCFPAYLYPAVRKKTLNQTQSLNQSSLWSASWNESQPLLLLLGRPSEELVAYFVDQSDLNVATNGLVLKVMFYTQAIFGKFVPCLLLVTFSSLLVHSLVIINRNNKKLTKPNKYYNVSKPSPSVVVCVGGNQQQQQTPVAGKSSLSAKSQLSKCQTDTKTSDAEKAINDYNISSSSSMSKQQLEEGKHLTAINKISQVDEREPEQSTILLAESSRAALNTNANVNPVKNENAHMSSVPKKHSLLAKIRKSSMYHGEDNQIEDDDEDSNVDCFKFKKKKQQQQHLSCGGGGKPITKAKNKRNRAKEHLRTTLMLTIVCFLFLITEFPQSILMFFSLIIGNSFYENVYLPLGDLLDIIALINNSINFLLYCTMSRAFRNTFYTLVINMWCCTFWKNTDTTSKCHLLQCCQKPHINAHSNFSTVSPNAAINNQNSKPSSGSKGKAKARENRSDKNRSIELRALV